MRLTSPRARLTSQDARWSQGFDTLIADLPTALRPVAARNRPGRPEGLTSHARLTDHLVEPRVRAGSMIHELREYVAADGRINDLHDRFREHTLDLFARHGIEILMLWTDADDPDRILYLVSFNDEDEQRRAWDAFRADPEWNAVRERSEQPGPLLKHAISRNLIPISYLTSNSFRPRLDN